MENSVSKAKGFLGDLAQYNQLRRSFLEYVDEHTPGIYSRFATKS